MKSKIIIILIGLLLPTLCWANFDVSLKYGSKGEAVIELQDFLQDQGFYSGIIDGRYGFGTMKSVKAWQKANNLKPDGFFGKGSRIKANEILDNLLKDSKETEQAEIVIPEPIVITQTPSVPVIPTPVEKPKEVKPVKVYTNLPPKAVVTNNKLKITSYDYDIMVSKIEYTSTSNEPIMIGNAMCRNGVCWTPNIFINVYFDKENSVELEIKSDNPITITNIELYNIQLGTTQNMKVQ